MGQVKDALLVFSVFIHLQESGIYEYPYPEQSVIVLTIVQGCVIIGCQLFLIQTSVFVYTLKRKPILWGEYGQGFGLNFVKAQSPSPPSNPIICRLFRSHWQDSVGVNTKKRERESRVLYYSGHCTVGRIGAVAWEIAIKAPPYRIFFCHPPKKNGLW